MRTRALPARTLACANPCPRGTSNGPFQYWQALENLKNSISLPAARYFGGIDSSPNASSPPKLLQAALKTTSAACAWPPGTAPTNHGHPHRRPESL